MDERQFCESLTKAGTRCRRLAKLGIHHCSTHDPVRIAQMVKLVESQRMENIEMAEQRRLADEQHARDKVLFDCWIASIPDYAKPFLKEMYGSGCDMCGETEWLRCDNCYF